MPKKRAKKARELKESKKGIDQGLAIACLIVNIFIPGLGSLIGGKIKQGIWQLILVFGGFFLGVLLTITIIGAIIGVPLLIFAPLAGWIWGIVTGVNLIKEAR